MVKTLGIRTVSSNAYREAEEEGIATQLENNDQTKRDLHLAGYGEDGETEEVAWDRGAGRMNGI